MKKTLLKFNFILLFAVILSQSFNVALSQQDPQFTQYFFNPLSINPAFAGSRDALSVTMLGRTQWVGFDGAPNTGSFTVHSPLKNESIALGASFIYDEIGVTQTIGAYADIAYRFAVSKKSRLSFGVKGGVDVFSADFASLRSTANNPNGPLLTTVQSQIMPNVGFGAYWYSPKYYVGITAPKLLENEIENTSAAVSQAKQNRHYFLTAGYTFKLSSTIEFLPSTLVKVVQNAPLSVDFNASFFFYEKFWIGAGYRFGDAATANIMYHFSPIFRAGYAYDYTLSPLTNYNSGSHEIMLNYDLDFLGKGFKTPRRF